MANNPPIPSKSSNPLQGSTEHKVITLGIQNAVREGRDKGTGYNALAKSINESILATSNVKISGMSIKRWCDEYYKEDQRDTTDHAVNLYSHYVDMLNGLSKQMEIQSVCIDELSKKAEDSVEDVMDTSKALNAAMMTYEKLSSRKIVLMQTIGSIQEKIYRYMAASEVVELTLGAVKAKDTVLYNEIMGELRKNQEYMELFRKISPNTK